MTKRYVVGLGLNEMNKVVYKVKDTVDGTVEVADTTKESKMLLDKYIAINKPSIKVTEVDRKAEFEARRKEAIKTKTGKKCDCCGREVSAHTLDFMRRNYKKVPANNQWYRKLLCVSCQRKAGIDKFLLKK